MGATSSTLRPLLAIAVVAIVGIGLVALRLASQQPESLAANLAKGHHVQQAQVFGSLEDMTAASDAVVRGTILAVRPGRSLPREAGGITFFDVSIRVDQVLHGSLADSTIELEIDNAMFPTVDRPARTWPIEGDATILFLHRKIDRPTLWRPVNSQGAYSVRAQVLAAADERDPFAASVAILGATGLEVKLTTR